MKAWIELIQSFAKASLSADAFKEAFFVLWSAQQDWSLIPDEAGEIISELFYDVDAYYGDPALFQEGDLDAESLQQSAIRALDALRLLVVKQP